MKGFGSVMRCAAFIALIFYCGCDIPPIAPGPVWSQNGQYVAYLVMNESDDRTGVRIFDFQTAAVYKPDISTLQVAEGGNVFYCLDVDLGLVQLAPPRFRPVPVSAAPRNIDWVAPRPGGQGVYCLTKTPGNAKNALLYIETGPAGNALSLVYEEEDLAYPVLSPDGGYLYITRKAGTEHEIARFNVLNDGSLAGEKVVFKDAAGAADKDNEPPGIPLPVPSPDGKRLLIARQENEVYLTDAEGRGRQRIGLPGVVFWGGFGPGNDDLRFVIFDEDEEAIRSVDVSIKTRKVTAIGPALRRLYGNLTLDPPGQVAAELSPGGLRIADINGLWQRFYPESDGERLHAAEAVIDKSPEEAMLYTDERKPRDVDGLRWYLVRAKAFALLADDRQAARNALEGLLLYPVSDLDIAALTRKLGALPIGVDPAALSVAASVDAQPKDSFNALDEAEPLIARSDMLAGVNFRRGHALFRLADFHGAAREFRKAAETELFPQRDYAAVLSIISFYLEGRVDLSSEVTAYLKEKMPTSPLLDDTARLGKVLAVWADRPTRRKIRLTPRVEILADEHADYRLVLSLAGLERVKVERLPRVRLALEKEDKDGGKKRRELVELAGFWAGYAPRQDNAAFAVAMIDGRDVEVTATKLPGVKLAAKRFPKAYENLTLGDETLSLEFSPSAARLFIKGAGVDLEMGLPETLP